MKPLHAGSNYKFLMPFIEKMKETGRNTFKAGLGRSRLMIEDMHYNFQTYGKVYRVRYADDQDKFYLIAVNDRTKTATPMRYVDEHAVSLDNSKPDLREVNCFWFSWSIPCPKAESMKLVDSMLWDWINYLTHREYYNVKYA